MVARRPLYLAAGGLLREIPDADSLLFGLEQNTSKVIDPTNGLTARTLSVRRTFLSGTAGASLALTLPAASAEIEGMLISVIPVVAARSNVTWISAGATFSGAPTSLASNVGVTLQYHHALTRWFITN